jgi:S1-C subfamily serine protease
MNRSLLLGAFASLFATQAAALDPSEVFTKVAPSVFAVRGLDANERPITYGSGVVIGPGRLITNCHVLAKAKGIQVRRSNVAYFGKLEHADVERDLCIVSVAEFNAPAVTIVPLASVRIGQRAYAVGNPERLDLTLSEGLISGLRAEDPTWPSIQTTAPVSPGSSGGGLFDDQGRLIGITTLVVLGRAKIAQNLNFAAPGEWIAEVPERAKEQLAKARAPREGKSAVAAITGTAGASWTYTFRDRVFGNRDREFSVRATAVDGSSVMEILSSGSEQQTWAASTQELGFHIRSLAGEDLIELSPYLLARVPTPTLPLPEVPHAYPGPGEAKDWTVRVTQVQREQISVPAGRFDAYRVTLAGENPKMSFYYQNGASSAGNDRPLRFEYEAWYAPEVGRYVQIRHQTWGRSGRHLSDEWVQLKTFSPAGAAPAEKKGG